MSPNRLTIYGVLALAAIALTAGATYFLTSSYYQGLFAGIKLVRETDTPYKYISPLLNVTLPKEVSGNQFAPLVNKVKAAAQAQPQDSLIRYSFYFRDLTNNLWTGINENDAYDPASMLKVVAAIAAYRQKEDHPGFFDTQPTYTQALAQANAEFPYAPKVILKVGQSYSVPFLIQSMLSDSDNAAKDLLLSSIDQPELNDIYTDLSVPAPDANDSQGYKISALDYSRFFRVLYNGTYISHEDSNQLLTYLTQSTFTHGIAAGVSSSTPVAHKFGEHVNGDGSIATSIELHDCGIVYYPSRPYFLCIMTEGQDEATLEAFIAKVSQIVSDAVGAGYK